MADKTPRILIPTQVREKVFERNNYQCQSCNKIDLRDERQNKVPIRKGEL